jgi:hypothetical protein
MASHRVTNRRAAYKSKHQVVELSGKSLATDGRDSVH